jgi:probable F420-dependent oxidoreductase
MRLGLMPTYNSMNVCSPGWVDDFLGLATDTGADSVWIAEHIVVPVKTTSPYPYTKDGRPPFADSDPLPDPIEWLAWAAGRTETLLVCPGVLILPQHNPLQLAKRLATLDRLSGGRAMVGVGAGWLREEIEAFGVRFEERGRVMDEYIAVLRALWSEGPTTYQGDYISFEELASYPKPFHPNGIPVIVGGNTKAAARRAGRLGDGFIPLSVGSEELVVLLASMTESAHAVGRDAAAIEVNVRARLNVDECRRMVELGVTRFLMSVRSDIPFAEARVPVERFLEIYAKV